MKHSLVFDVTDANTIADSDSVGAYLRASDGTLLTHTDVGGKKALDVRVAEGINVEVDLSHVDDSVKVGDGTDFLAINADGSINITDNGGSLTVDATDLDIRDLSHSQDSVKIGDGTDFLAIDASGNIGVTDAGGSLTVDGTVSISGTVTVTDAALANTAVASAANTLGLADTAEDVVASPLANRKYLWVLNNSNRDVYIGATGVTSANGFPLPPQSLMELRCGASIDLEWVGPTTGLEIRTLELS